MTNDTGDGPDKWYEGPPPLDADETSPSTELVFPDKDRHPDFFLPAPQQPSVAGMLENAGTLGAAISDLFGELQGFATAVLQALSGNPGALVSWVIDHLTDLSWLEDLGDDFDITLPSIEDILTAVYQALTGGGTGAAGSLKEFSDNIFQQIIALPTEILGQVWEAIQHGGDGVAGDIGQWAEDLVESIPVVGPIIEQIRDALEGNASDAGPLEDIRNWAEGVQNDWQSIIDKVVQGFHGGSSTGNPVDALADVISQLLGKANTADGRAVAAQSAASTADTKATAAKNDLQSLIDGFVGGTGNALAQLISGLTGVRTTATNAGSAASSADTKAQSAIDLGWQGASGGSGTNKTATDLKNALAALLGTANTANTNAGSAQSAINNLAAGVAGAGAGINDLISSLLGTKNTANNAGSQITSLDGRVTALEGVGTRTQYTTSQTWTNPSPTVRKKIMVVCINAGTNGLTSSTAASAKGGRAGGLIAREFFTDQLPSSVAITIGASNGAVTSFGSYLSGIPGLGGIIRTEGTYATSATPGRGGDKVYNGSEVTSLSEPGGDTAFAAGGARGSSGANGDAAPSGLVCGGGGGGAGTGGLGSKGGNGGFPGGGGGAGYVGNPGTGAAGCMWITVFDA